MSMVSAGDFKNGLTLEMDGSVCQIKEFQHVKPGKGAAFVRATLRDILKGGIIEKTFRPTEKFEQAVIERVDMQYLYNDGMYNFMNNTTFEQIALSPEQVGDVMKFVKENEICKVMYYNGKVFSVEPPLKVTLEVTDTEPGIKGDTAGNNAMKPATVETGASVMVPLFINKGEKIIVSTETGKYESRA